MNKRNLSPRFKIGSMVYYHENHLIQRISGIEVQTQVKSGTIAECIRNEGSCSYKLAGAPGKIWPESVLMGQPEETTWRGRLKKFLGSAFSRGPSRSETSVAV